MDSPTPLTEAALRGLVRDAIARARAGRPVAAATSGPERSPAPETSVPPVEVAVPSAVTVHVHASQAQFVLGPGGDADGNCIIEPAVRCTHCGFCQTLGH